MVISTGMLMAYEAIALILGRSSGTDCRAVPPTRTAALSVAQCVAAALLRPLVRRAHPPTDGRP